MLACFQRCHRAPGVALVSEPIESFGDDPELHDQVAREVL
jgi:hypothetical protein